ncbi:hypothetical protein LZ017_16460 [Pelomonas sp. CA6]|uniref:hypothetical protein n=1 Tax=Pelomonas sp. CA6 TaxID=2907999 RepID=UPI001F4C206C|nr:hypothetical protein [Pelomonas sp. CA6]MCH7344975.1 hypothetical protein [Pelomonas sp. CA6]
MTLTLRSIPDFPPPWAYASVRFPQASLSDRRGRAQAREHFLALKLACSRAAAELQGPGAGELQARIRTAGEPIELWVLSHPLLEALPTECPRAERHRADIDQLLCAFAS